MSKFRAAIIEELPHLRRYARALLRGDADAADDLVQACIERALSRQYLWKPPGRLRSWLFTIMHNIFINTATTKARRKALLAGFCDRSEIAATPDQHTRLESQEVLEAMDRLPEEFRTALCLVALEDVSYAEAAKILGIPVGTLMSRLHRARACLRASLDELPSAGARPRLHSVK
jgi:RNA polymerase sigma-70 factor (ECF subfamily)